LAKGDRKIRVATAKIARALRGEGRKGGGKVF